MKIVIKWTAEVVLKLAEINTVVETVTQAKKGNNTIAGFHTYSEQGAWGVLPHTERQSAEKKKEQRAARN